jgi:hypothetical protein
MFDEVDEGTAMFKLASTANEVPAAASIVTLDADGEMLPTDWYLQLAREAQQRLSGVRTPLSPIRHNLAPYSPPE